jgi:hypothetical protein
MRNFNIYCYSCNKAFRRGFTTTCPFCKSKSVFYTKNLKQGDLLRLFKRTSPKNRKKFLPLLKFKKDFIVEKFEGTGDNYYKVSVLMPPKRQLKNFFIKADSFNDISMDGKIISVTLLDYNKVVEI